MWNVGVLLRGQAAEEAMKAAQPNDEDDEWRTWGLARALSLDVRFT